MNSKMVLKGNFIWIIAIFVVVFSITNSVIISSKNQKKHKSTNRLTSIQRAYISSGDIGIKVILSKVNNEITDTYKLISYKTYKRALPSPQALRRLGIFNEIILKEPGDKWFRQLKNNKSSIKHFDEYKMWMDIFNSSNISITKARIYENTIGNLDIGPLKRPALAELYKKTNQYSKMQEVNEKAYYNSCITVSLISIGFMITIFAFFSGICLLIWFIKNGKKYNSKILNDSYEGNNLLESFIIYIIALALAKIFLGIVLDKKILGDQINGISLALQIITNTICFVISMLVYSLWKMNIIDAFKKIFGAINIKASLKWGIGGYICLSPLIYISILISNIIFKNYTTMEHPLQQITGRSGYALFFAGFLAVIAAPIIEEYIFRGMLYGALRSKTNVLSSCIISGAIFSVLHPTMPGQFFPLLILGAGLALIREKTGSLLPSIICHATNNGIMFIAMILMS